MNVRAKSVHWPRLRTLILARCSHRYRSSLPGIENDAWGVQEVDFSHSSTLETPIRPFRGVEKNDLRGPPPSRPIDRGLVEPGLLAHILDANPDRFSLDPIHQIPGLNTSGYRPALQPSSHICSGLMTDLFSNAGMNPPLGGKREDRNCR